MDTFEIKDDDIDVNDIMHQIQENIKKRRESGVYTTKEMDTLIDVPLQHPSIIENAEQNTLQHNLDYINSNWDVNTEYTISSHRPVLGKILIWGRQLLHGEVKRYVELIVGKQTRFNTHLAAAINKFDRKIEEHDERISKVFTIINEDIATINKDIENKIWIANQLEERIKQQHCTLANNNDNQDDININYFIFKENIGMAWRELSGECVQKVPNVFDDALSVFDECKNVLEIGSGEGEFLQMLNQKGIEGYGIDINEDFIIYSKRKGLDVEHVDALTHLKSLPDKSLDGLFAAHVIEHLQLPDLMKLIELCYAKMQFGSHIILVTPNILNITVSSNTFYMDPTHVNHIHPDVIKFILESYGFRDIQKRYYQPVPDELKLKKFDCEIISNIDDKKTYETMNNNIDVLNNLLFGYRDFAVIAKK